MLKQWTKTSTSFLRRSLSIQLLSVFIFMIVVVVLAFSTHAISRERARVRRELQAKGELLANHLAFSSRLGVFAENKDLLKDVAEGVVSEPDVVLVGIYNADMKPLYFMRKASLTREGQRVIRTNDGPGGMDSEESLSPENKDALTIQKPVVIKRLVNEEKALYIEEQVPHTTSRTIGQVRIALSPKSMYQEMRNILALNAMVALLFISVSVVVIYLWVRRVMKPLETLTVSVKALGRGEDIAPVPVVTGDEIGKLAAAFNTMLDERKCAEQALERVLMDIHDGIGGITTNISLLSAIAQKTTSPGNVNNALTTISDLAREGMGEIRNLMFSLDSDDLSWSTLVGELKSHGAKRVEPHSIAFEMTADLDQATARPTRLLCLHLFRIYREALTNVVKHSKAKNLIVSLRVGSGRLSLLIRDDGNGCGKTVFFGGGRGVGNMKARSAELGGMITINGDAGTCVAVDIPLSPDSPCHVPGATDPLP